MGQYLPSRTPPTPCDLSPEQIEEIRMLTLLPVEDIQHMRLQYLRWSTDDRLTKDAFFAIPVIARNPLKERLWSLFESSPDGHVSFHVHCPSYMLYLIWGAQAFVLVMAVFTYHSSKDSKLRASFKMHDFDGDGRLSRADLLSYLRLVADPGDMSEDIEKAHLVARTLEEASSDAAAEFLTFDDFTKVVLTTEFEAKLQIPL
ncbi:calcineurin regulatory subunit B [Achlya hypogyna]|uniref:Calcineurin regulatory subunit B n=1 Tax=Achlya hypogyna TaxID=1202772 RepID=A0A1V9YFZ7_ACHHY|nr:calcineurin regulatory subunit B [Achlya hypogyna]